MRRRVTLLFDPDNDWLLKHLHAADWTAYDEKYELTAAMGDPDAVIGQDIVFILG